MSKKMKVRIKKTKVHSTRVWPVTDDQKAQSRPLIVVRPVRRLKQHLELDARAINALGSLPKHFLDTEVMRQIQLGHKRDE